MDRDIGKSRMVVTILMSTRANTEMIRSMGMENSLGPQAASTEDNT